MALKKVKGSIDRIFDKNLQDLVRGIRNHKETEGQFVSQCIDEIKVELKQENVAVKANAVNKLIYLQMLGYDISWAAFNIIEVMSSPKFTFKRIGYLAASQCFNADTDVLMLTTNMIRKDLTSQNRFDAGIALNGLSCFITPDLARDLANDILALMSSIRPYTRKRAVLISYKIFLCYPEALRPAFPRLKEKLEDPDPGVQSAAVNVICELARKNPKNYLSLAPIFFKLMTTSTNNWVLIKIIKLFGALTPLEPRLGKKLIEPLTNLIHNTSAMSLLYECINTVVQGMQDHSSSIQLCVQKLRVLIEDSDQNLKYLGLLAMSRILKTHPKAVQAHKDLILQCLDDKDESIRLRALDLLFGMVSRKNLMEIVKKLMLHVEKADGSQYRDELILKIIEICSQNNFQYITNFEWYITVLVELTRMDGKSRHGPLVSNQILDVAIRVKTIQEFAATQMGAMLENAHAITAQLKRNGMQEVLYAAAYICGEFAKFLDRPDVLIQAMLRPRVLSLPGHIQACYLQNVMKLYSSAIVLAYENDDREKCLNLTKSLLEKLPLLVQSSNLEVQERASCLLSMLKYVEKLQNKDLFQAEQFTCLFKGELNPVAPKAQRKVPVPQGLDLDAWINDPPSSSSDEEPQTFEKTTYEYEDYSPSKKTPSMTPEEMARRKEERAREQASNPNYLMSQKGYQDPEADSDINGISEIDINVPLHVPGMTSSERYLRMEQEHRRRKQAEKQVKKRKKKKKSKVVSDDEEDDITQHHVVDVVTEEMPDGAVKTDSEDDSAKIDPHKALDIDLESPLAPSDALPKPRHRDNQLKSQNIADEKSVEVKKEKKKTKKIKKHKKKSHKSKGKGESLLVEEPTNEEEAPIVNGIEENEVEKVVDPSDDINFWLSTGDSQKADDNNKKEEQLVNNVEDEIAEIDAKPKKEKKQMRKKDGKKHKKQKEKEQQDETETEKNVEEIPVENEFPRYKLLCENKNIKIEFSTQVFVGNNKKFGIVLLISNLSEDEKIHGIEFDILDTLNTRLVRHDAKPVLIQFSLPPLSRNECLVEATSQSVIMPQRLRGSVNYSCGSDAESLDFKLHVPCSTYLVQTPCSSHKFTELLSSGSVSDKSSIRVTTNLDMDGLLRKLCFILKFSVVERIDDSASLFVSSMQGHNLCLLIKYISSSVINVDGKSDNLSLLSNVMDEVRTNILSTN